MVEPITDRLALEWEYAEAAELLEGRFAAYLDPVADEDLKAAYDHDRYLFGRDDAIGVANPDEKFFPALTVEEVSSLAEPEKKSGLPERMLFVVRVYHPSLHGRLLNDSFQVSRDARGDAKRVTRRVFGRWRKAFHEDKSLRRAVESTAILETESGDADRLGNLRISESGRSVLWVHRATIEVRP